MFATTPRPVRRPAVPAAPTARAAAPSLVAAGALAALGLLTACNGPRVVNERPVLVTGQRVPSVDVAAAGAIQDAQGRQQAAQHARDSLLTVATATCDAATCGALTRGEIALGMTEAQVMAATRSTPGAWSVRRSGGTAAMTPASLLAAPNDVTGEVALVQLAEGRVRAIGYRETSGLRLVEKASDATVEGRARATAENLIREGDQLNAAGDRAAALDRYDRALVFLPNDPMLQYRVATLLDLQLRPVEALIRYQRFLQNFELQRIEAIGNANAKLGEAIARAQQRIVVLQGQLR
jgi:tetratricopeptide (TPR) repeat protein